MAGKALWGVLLWQNGYNLHEICSIRHHCSSNSWESPKESLPPPPTHKPLAQADQQADRRTYQDKSYQQLQSWYTALDQLPSGKPCMGFPHWNKTLYGSWINFKSVLRPGYEQKQKQNFSGRKHPQFRSRGLPRLRSSNELTVKELQAPRSQTSVSEYLQK